MRATESLADLTSTALTSRLEELVREERLCLVDILWHLAEMDRRHTHVELGYPSLFAWCTEYLKLSNAAAWRRTTSARLLMRFPVAADYLADGRLCLSTFVLLRDLLLPENHRELLERAAGLSEDEVKKLVATRQPRPEVPESIRRLPRPILTSGPERTVDSLAAVPAAAAVPSSGPERTVDSGMAVPVTPPAPGSGPERTVDTHAALPGKERPRIEPIDAQRYSVKLTVGSEFIDELAEVKSALSHLVPDGNLEAVMRVCFQKTLELCAQRKHGARRSGERSRRLGRSEVSTEPETVPAPAPIAATTAPPRERKGRRVLDRYIPAEVRRAVWKRDGGRCAFVGKDGKRCGSKHQLEFDHLQPHARGGPPTVGNLALHCRAHNLHRARKHFGAELLAKFTRRCFETNTS